MTRGRRREHYQWNMDVWGVPGVEAEAELIAAVFALLDRLGLARGDVRVRVSSRATARGARPGAARSTGERFARALRDRRQAREDRPRGGGGAAHRPGGPGRASAPPRRTRSSASSPCATWRRPAAASPPPPAPALAELDALFELPRRLRRRRPRRLRRLDRAGPRLLHGRRLRGLRRGRRPARDLRGRALRPAGREPRRAARCPAAGFGFGDAVIGELLEDEGAPAGAPARARRRGRGRRRRRRRAARRRPLRDPAARRGARRRAGARRAAQARSPECRPVGSGARAPDRAGRAGARRRPGARPRDRERARRAARRALRVARRTGAATKRYRYRASAELRHPAARRKPAPPSIPSPLRARHARLDGPRQPRALQRPELGARLLRREREGPRRGARARRRRPGDRPAEPRAGPPGPRRPHADARALLRHPGGARPGPRPGVPRARSPTPATAAASAASTRSRSTSSASSSRRWSRFGADDGIGLEAGSKPELLVALALLDTPGALIICNGYKDRAYVETALLAQRLGRTPIIVIDRFSELDLVIKTASRARHPAAHRAARAAQHEGRRQVDREHGRPLEVRPLGGRDRGGRGAAAGRQPARLPRAPALPHRLPDHRDPRPPGRAPGGEPHLRRPAPARRDALDHRRAAAASASTTTARRRTSTRRRTTRRRSTRTTSWRRSRRPATSPASRTRTS